MADVLVIGYGNPLRGDDGAGWAIAAQLRLLDVASKCEIRTCHQLMPELAADFGEFGAVILIDASAEQEAGTLAIRELAPVAAAGLQVFSHHVTPEALLTMCAELHGRAPRAWLLTIGGKDFGFSEEVSPELAPTISDAVRAIAQIIRTLEEC
jgi:hydrogenase maturation protease